MGSKLYMLHVTNPTIGVMSRVDRKAWAKSIDSIQCSKVATCMTIEFERHFPIQELLNANAIIYPQYSLAPKTKTTFLEHLAIIIAHF